MREILFRGKNKYNNEWVYGQLIIGNNYNFIITKEDYDDVVASFQTLVCQCHPVEKTPNTVGQYTGLTDKNGKKIFEGDIVGCFCNTQLFEVKWCDVRGGYFLDDVVLSSCCEPAPECLGNLTDTMEIIGNIWDNPELLKENEDDR